MNNFEKIKEYEAHKEPVPSYEEWEQTQNWADFTSDYHILREKIEITEYEKAEFKERLKKTQELELEVRRENTKLKELLKEVQSKIRYSSPRGIETFADLDDTLLAKINQALGDKNNDGI